VSRSKSTRWRTTSWATPTSPRELAEAIETAQLFLYPGDRHLFTDSNLPDYDEGATTLVKQRVLAFLDNIE
jgi:dienelactone hydrolase